MVGPGQSLRVPPGLPHHFANVGNTEVHAVVETRPPLSMEALLRVAAGLAVDDRGRARRLPRPLDLVLFMHEFRAEVRAPYLPAGLVRRSVAGLVPLIRLFGLDRHYRGLRSSSVAARTGRVPGAAGHRPRLTLNVLLRVYAKCIAGQDDAVRRRVEAALRAGDVKIGP